MPRTAKERIEKAKQLHGLAEEKTDSLLLSLVKSPLSLLAVVGYGVACFVAGAVLF